MPADILNFQFNIKFSTMLGFSNFCRDSEGWEHIIFPFLCSSTAILSDCRVIRTQLQNCNLLNMNNFNSVY